MAPGTGGNFGFAVTFSGNTNSSGNLPRYPSEGVLKVALWSPLFLPCIIICMRHGCLAQAFLLAYFADLLASSLDTSVLFGPQL